MNSKSSYRPHNPGHDYYAPGVYLITLVVRNRERNHELLGRLNGDVKAPAVVNTEVGKVVINLSGTMTMTILYALLMRQVLLISGISMLWCAMWRIIREGR